MDFPYNCFSLQHPPLDKTNLIPILSIDGGGIRGIIPGVILEYLEEQLQFIDKDTNPNAKLADYFDVIAGTSTGGLVATLLTTPSEHGQQEPKFTAKDIVPFYLEEAPKIFDQSRFSWWKLPRKARALMGPLYDGKELRRIVNEFLGMKTRLCDTLTHVVIPTFDIRSMKPVIFSSFKVPEHREINASMYDICVATSAAPTYLPGHYFRNDGHDFNLVDGGVAANNPTAVAMEEVLRHVLQDIKDSKDCNTIRHPYSQFLVLSLGTGTGNDKPKYDVKTSSQWGLYGWVVSNANPLMRIFMEASDELVDYRVNNVFDIIHCPDQFLRIQDDTLTGELPSVDIASKENLKALNQVGTNLLSKTVRRLNPHTGTYDPVSNGVTNRKALQEFAQRLSDIRRSRVIKGMDDLATKKENVIRLVKQNMGIHE